MIVDYGFNGSQFDLDMQRISTLTKERNEHVPLDWRERGPIRVATSHFCASSHW